MPFHDGSHESEAQPIARDTPALVEAMKPRHHLRALIVRNPRAVIGDRNENVARLSRYGAVNLVSRSRELYCAVYEICENLKGKGFIAVKASQV